MKQSILLAALFFIVSHGIGQNVNIPDSTFKSYLLNDTTINTNGDTTIQMSEAMAYSGMIDCAALGIADLTGIEAFTAITVLRCDSNSLNSLDVSQNVALTHLSCTFNVLSGLDVTQNINLVELNCNNTTVSNYDLSQNTSLTHFYCANNPFFSFDFSQNALLEVIDISNGFLGGIDLTNNPALREVYVHRNNSVAILDLSQNVNLEVLNCRNNSIVDLDLSQTPGLVYLDCRDNDLTTLNIANGNNTNLNLFRANSNDLTCITVDDIQYAVDSLGGVDPGVYFSTDCSLPAFVNEITVTGQGGVTMIDTVGGTLQMLASIMPAVAADTTVSWSSMNLSGMATIDNQGRLTAIADGVVTVVATANDGSGIVGQRDITISNQTVGIQESVLADFKAYPNPANDVLYFSTPVKVDGIKLLDITGKTVKKTSGDAQYMNLSGIKSGVYFIEVRYQKQTKTLRLIKE